MNELNIVTFNIRCFGFNGDYFARHRYESRIPHLKNFIEANFSAIDVFIFQEIMDPRIINEILPQGFKTYTYKHDFPQHMFIVIACKNDYEIESFQILPGTTIDDTRSRPAVYGKLTHKSLPLLHLIGVHLKSKQEHTDDRIFQCEVISNFINTLPAQVPLIVAGDFNSHAKEKTSLPKNDISCIEEIFDEQLNLVEQQKATYLSPTNTVILDHFFARGVQVLSVEVFDLSKDQSTKRSAKKYFKEISDHLPVRLKIKI